MSTSSSNEAYPFTNRLIHETSPYLLQHAHNPVDWYPWSAEAFEKARVEDKPIFLSIGYSSCHWCHVMEHESFEMEAVAQVLNEGFVSIKVDREERPDLDEIYMTAVQILTRRGGWPMSTWLLPDGRPFHGGTYYPAQQFVQLLQNISEVYQTRRNDVEANAANLTQVMADMAAAEEQASGTLSRSVVENAISRMGANFDESYGGFGRAPKFPPSTGLPLLLHEYERTKRADPIRWTTKTLDAMAMGGIHDHLAGGFHRYSTDRQWLLPHFEKMVYDNAQLSRLYADAWRVTGRPEYRAVAEGVYDWVLREMTGEEGGFYSTLDADSEGEEGKFYTWEREEVLRILGAEDGEFFCRIYSIEPNGNFMDEATHQPTGRNIPHLTRSLADHAKESGLSLAEFNAKIAKMRAKLLSVRVERVWPGLDDKILTGWNGLMIGSFAHGGKTLNRPEYVEAAARAADFILTHLQRDGKLLRTYRNGESKLGAYLEDYAFMAYALLDLHDATSDPKWLTEARNLADSMIRRFGDDDRGGFYNTADDHEEILLRTKSSYDQALPSGNSMAALSLLRLADLTGESRYRVLVRRLLGAYLGVMEQNPQGVETMIRAAALYLESSGKEETSEREVVPASAAGTGAVTASAELSETETLPGGRVSLRLTLEIAAGWHINSHEPLQEYLNATQIRVSAGDAVSVGMIRPPEPKEVRLGFSEEPLSVFEGTPIWTIPLHVSRDARPGTIPVRVFVDYQPCNDDACGLPETLMLEVELEVRS